MIYVIEGTQWGDEGKGKITDYLGQKMDIIVRHQGGNNAGHTIVIGEDKFALSALPSGIVNPNITNVIASGVVLNIPQLIRELTMVKEKGLPFKLLISNRAHIIMPYHVDLDGAYEGLLSKHKIGTTKKGIGPCYQDKAARRGIRVGDLLEPSYLKERLASCLLIKNMELKLFGKEIYDFNSLYKKLIQYGELLKPYITDTSKFINKAIKENKNILFEGAQGSMLCLNYGTYPYVTSSSPLANSVPLNAGIPPKSIDKVIGIMKAYTTRVGEGPFVTELHDKTANLIRTRGHEYGTVTRRPRRVGYLDLMVVKHTVELSGMDSVAIMLLDVLTGVKDLNVCVGYKLDGQEIDYIPSTIKELERVVPIYRSFPSWHEDITKVRNYDDLPKEAKEYIEFIESFLGVPACLISVGPERNDTIIKHDLF